MTAALSEGSLLGLLLSLTTRDGQRRDRSVPPNASINATWNMPASWCRGPRRRAWL